MRTAVLLLPALLLAGCFAAEEPLETADVEATPRAVASATEASASQPPPPTAVVPRDHPFAVSGRIGTNACVPAGPNFCVGLPAGTPSENTLTRLAYNGAPTHVEATLTWDALTPATEEMYVAVVAARSCGDGCYEWDEGAFAALASGASPLVLSAADVTLREGEMLYMEVGPVSALPTAPGLFYYLDVEQPFEVEGNVVALVPAARASA